MTTHVETRYSTHPDDVQHYDTAALRKHFHVPSLMKEDEITLCYSHYERMIVGGVVPVKTQVELTPVDQLKSDYFLARRELGVINVGGKGTVTVDDVAYPLGNKEGLYVGMGNKRVTFSSDDASAPARFYINSTPAHHAYPDRHMTLDKCNVLHMGSQATCNERDIYQLLIKGVIETCQLQMGITLLKSGSVWNTMPAHQHDRRMEAYFYFDLAPGQAVCHFMGQPKETRHLWMANEEAVLSPAWSIHSGCGTSNYAFIWSMAGENLDYNDMDKYAPDELR